MLSGKGGVGKSTFTSTLAHGLAQDQEKQVKVCFLLSKCFYGNVACFFWSSWQKVMQWLEVVIVI